MTVLDRLTDRAARDDRAARKAADAAARDAHRAQQAAAREARDAADRDARVVRQALARQARAARWAARRASAWTATAKLGRAARPVVPLLLVTGFAGVGQVLWAMDNVAPPELDTALKLVMAIGAACAVESISLNVQWHAHDAQIHGRLASAARLRRASYAIALLVAAINYAHFAKEDGSPTPAAVMFALFSAASPWLWGLHTRRVREIHLAESGARVDVAGAAFAPIRWRLFPLRTFGAWRWSVDHNVTDPAEAWAGYAAQRASDRTDRDEQRRQRETAAAAAAAAEKAKVPADGPPAPPVVEPPAVPPAVAPPADTDAPPAAPTAATSVALATVPPPVVRADTNLRRTARPTTARTRRTARRAGGPAAVTDEGALTAAREHTEKHGLIRSRDAFRTVTGTGGERSVRLFAQYKADHQASPVDTTEDPR